MTRQETARHNVGPCPRCGIYPNWFNDVPLRAFCWGTDAKPHLQLSRLVTGIAQPYASIQTSFWQVFQGEKWRTYQATALDCSKQGVKS